MVQKVKVAPQQQEDKRVTVAPPLSATINRDVPQNIINEQLCHLNEAVTRLSKRTQDTNGMLRQMIELQMDQFEQTKATNELLFKIYNEMKDSKDVLETMSSEIDKLENIARKTDTTSEIHNRTIRDALNAFIAAVHGEEAIEKIISQAKAHSEDTK